jgi:hypothetical protein
MSYTVYYETAGRRGVALWAEPSTVNANLALACLHEHAEAGQPSWIRCGNGQVITGWI